MAPAWRALPLALALLLATALPFSGAAQEPLRRTVGHYELIVSYAQEPPRLEVNNALELEVRDARAGGPVAGLEDSLRVEGTVTIQGVNAVERRFPIVLRAARDRPGVYEGVFVPPALGRYRFRVVGVIGDQPVDETFSSGEGGLPEVGVAERSYTSPGALLGLGILGAYLAGLAGLVVWRLRRRKMRPA